jgi:RNA polymerase sigma-70 factor (ECF subfamily)
VNRINQSLDDSQIRRGIEQGGSQRRIYEDRLYNKYMYLINNGVWKHKITEDESSMAYSDTILTVIDHIVKNRFEGRSELKTYVNQIFLNKCVDIIRKKTTNKSSVYQTDVISEYVTQLPDELQNSVQKLIAAETIDRIWKHLKDLGEKCYLLVTYWHSGYADKEVAEMLEFNSPEVVKTSRSRCLKKLRELFNE